MTLLFDHRYEDRQLTLRSAMDGRQSETWTALPGLIQTYDAEASTVTVQPAIQALQTGGDLSRKFVNLPILPDVPVIFPRGGDTTMTFPIKPGDECLVVFSSRCIDNWWDQGGVQPQRELRMHDLSDGFAIVGPFSQKTKISSVSTTTTQIRSTDGKFFIELDVPNKKARVVMGANTEVDIDGSTDTVTVHTGQVNVIASKDVVVNATNVTVNATSQAAVNAATANVTTSGAIVLRGSTISMN